MEKCYERVSRHHARSFYILLISIQFFQLPHLALSLPFSNMWVNNGANTSLHPARVFNTEELAVDAILTGKIKKGDVLVIRYEGPKGGPGKKSSISTAIYLSMFYLDRLLWE